MVGPDARRSLWPVPYLVSLPEQARRWYLGVRFELELVDQATAPRVRLIIESVQSSAPQGVAGGHRPCKGGYLYQVSGDSQRSDGLQAPLPVRRPPFP